MSSTQEVLINDFVKTRVPVKRDLVERLRELGSSVAPSDMHKGCLEAAAEIERLRTALKDAHHGLDWLYKAAKTGASIDTIQGCANEWADDALSALNF
jgi:hypothetical protein